MCTLISLVGKQPGAVAATAKTLFVNEGLKKIVLLVTERTEDECARLVEFLQTLADDSGRHLELQDILPRFINTDPQATSRYPFAWGIIEHLIERADLPEPIYYDASPGLNYQVALISRHLKDKPVIPIYADYKDLYKLTKSPESWPLKDIGLAELLRLHGYSEPQFNNIWKKLNILPLKTIERKGRLYGLAKIWRDRSARPPAEDHSQEDKNESNRIKQEARNIEALLQFPRSLNYLQPRICVWTNDYLIYNRLKAYEIEAVMDEKSSQTLEQASAKWHEFMDKPPGWFKAAVTESKFDMWKPFHNEGGSWTGGNLIVSLGNDPSATLLAIFTHQPKKLILLVDPTTAWVQAMAGRIFENRKEIPAREIVFLPFDLKGKSFLQTLETEQKKGEWAANISPGSKAQTWNLSQFQNLRLWSLKNEDQSAVPLMKDDSINPISYSFPPIVLQAKVVGGSLQKTGIGQDDLKKRAALLKTMIYVIAEKSGRSGYLEFLDEKNRPTKLPWSAGKKIWIDQNNFIRCLKVDEVNRKIMFEACYKGKKCAFDYVNCENTIGHWLEEPIAGAFMAAGEYEINDIRAGIRWDWMQLQKKENNDFYRTDIDVLLNWMGVYLGISCKLGGTNKRKLENARAEIMAEARAGLGRFALPILVRGGIKINEALKVAENSIRNGGPLEIGLCLLDRPTTLNHLVEDAIKNLRTLGED